MRNKKIDVDSIYKPFIFNPCLFFVDDRLYLLNTKTKNNKTIKGYSDITSIKNVIRNAYIDKLTGFYIKAYLHEYIDSLVEKHYDFCLVIGDIDNFRSINDCLGHFKADKKLNSCGKLILNNIFKDDFVFRTGGDEFVIVSKITDLDKQVVNYSNINTILKEENEITCSFGLIKYNYNYGHHDNLNYLDEVLYKSKKSGKEKITVGIIGGECGN